jgi:hypothetical protein
VRTSTVKKWARNVRRVELIARSIRIRNHVDTTIGDGLDERIGHPVPRLARREQDARHGRTQLALIVEACHGELVEQVSVGIA